VTGNITPVYETASTRKYLHGRTETCRSLSSESAVFVESFDNEKMNVSHSSITLIQEQ